MPENLKPYPAYKDSGVPWLVKVPEHWEVRRNKLFLREIDDRSQTGTEELLTVSQYTGVTRRRDRISDDGALLTNAASLTGYKRVSPGDIVINIMLAWNGSLGVSPLSGIVSPAYCVFRSKTDTSPRFLHYLFRTPLFKGVFKTASTGVVDSRLRLYPDVFFRLLSVVPPASDQVAIVRYLDYADRKVRHAIHARQQLIKLLTEQKQAIIQRAVTRGLDPNVRLRPSGIQWLGDIPETWEPRRLKDWCNINERVLPETADVDLTFQYVDIGSVEAGRLVRQPQRMRFGTAPSRARRILRKGDTIVSTVRTYLKAVWFVSDDVQDWIASTGFAVFTPRVDTEPKYVSHFLQSNAFTDCVVMESVGIAYPAIAYERLASIAVAVPPLAEQTAIVKFLDAAMANLDTAIDAAHREIDLLREYRTRLIADVVTGKVDVRDAAAHLPDEPEEQLEPLDEEPADDVADLESEEEGNGEQTET
jgi:type I restriction enzyme S subunit